METIRFYDTSILCKVGKILGPSREIDIDDLLSAKREENPSLFQEQGYIDKMSTFEFDPLATKRTRRWECALASMIYAISSQIPTRKEIIKGRYVLDILPKNFRKQVDRDFVLSFLPYILVGFDFHASDNSSNESNPIINVARFINDVYESPKLTAWTFLCAHRESGLKKVNSLVDEVVVSKAERALSLELGLLSNSHVDTSVINWFQQPATERASSNMFPEMFLSYFNQGAVSDLLLLLDKHFNQMGQLCNGKKAVGVDISLLNLDQYTQSLEEMMDDFFGRQWRQLTIGDISNRNHHDFYRLATKYTVPEVRRFMPFFSSSSRDQLKPVLVKQNLDRADMLADGGAVLSTGIHLIEATKHAIDWFSMNQNMSLDAKALYETMFYYVWGMELGRNGGIGIGFERDFSRFQVEAWKMGYSVGQSEATIAQEGIPLLYARRVENEVPGGRLGQLSFRQFWRSCIEDLSR